MLSLWANWLQLNSQLNSPGVSFWLYRTFQCIIIFLYHLIFFLHPLSVLIFLSVLDNFLIKTVLNASFPLCNVINFTNTSIFTVVWVTCIFKNTHTLNSSHSVHTTKAWVPFKASYGSEYRVTSFLTKIQTNMKINYQFYDFCNLITVIILTTDQFNKIVK